MFDPTVLVGIDNICLIHLPVTSLVFGLSVVIVNSFFCFPVCVLLNVFLYVSVIIILLRRGLAPLALVEFLVLFCVCISSLLFLLFPSLRPFDRGCYCDHYLILFFVASLLLL